MKTVHDYDAIDRSVRCKVCMHEHKEQITRLITSKMSYDKIVERYPDLNAQNISTHWRNHMAPAIRIGATNAIEEAAIEVKDSIAELTKLFDLLDGVLKTLIENLDPKSKDYLNQINAVRGVINAKTQMIKLNMSLVGDTKQTRDQINIMAAMTAVKKQLDDEAEKQALAEYRKENQ